LESKLRALMASGGSTLYALTWKVRTTPSGHRICARRASVRRTSDSACSSWPSPTVNDAKGSAYSYGNGDHTKPCLKLVGAARLAGWPTAAVTNAERGGDARRFKGSQSQGGRRSNLQDAVMLAGWQTPQKGDETRGAEGPATRAARGAGSRALWGVGRKGREEEGDLVAKASKRTRH
jgi:hypothetical protein